MDLIGIVATIVAVGLVVAVSYLARRAAHSHGLELVLQGLMVLGGSLQVVGGLVLLAISPYLAAGIGLSGILWITVAFKGVARFLLRPMPLEPLLPIHRVAAALAFGMAAVNISVAFSWHRVADRVDVEGLGSLVSLSLLLVNDIGLLAVAMAGIGWPEERDLSSALKRLGIAPLGTTGVLWSLGAAGALLAFGFGVEAGVGLLGMEPDRASEIAMKQMLALAAHNPLRIFVIAAATGLSEEVLFRGALQPRLGLLMTSLVFASFHVQYGVGIGFVEVFVAGVVLGILREKLGTLAAAVSHGVYNAGVLTILTLGASATQ